MFEIPESGHELFLLQTFGLSLLFEVQLDLS